MPVLEEALPPQAVRSASRDSGRKHYYTLIEFASILDITPNAVRYWSEVFVELRGRRRGGRYYFVPAQIDLGRQIRELVNERGMTLRGAYRAIYATRDRRRQRPPERARDVVAMVRSELLAVARILRTERRSRRGDGEPR